MLAGVFDALDGFVARATNTQSDFGMQLDSIADVMNFGCAPGLLLYCYGFAQTDRTCHPTLVRIGGLACFVFVACGALRLARFKLSSGAPTRATSSACRSPPAPPASPRSVVAWPDPGGQHTQAFLVMALMVAVGALMVSTVRFPSSKHPERQGMIIIVAAAQLLIVLAERFFVLFFLVYISPPAASILLAHGLARVAQPIIYADEEEV